MKNYGIQFPLMMPDIDYGTWGSLVEINPPGGKVGPTIASSATIAPTKPIHIVSGTESITTITVPWTGFQGELTLIAAGAFTMTTTGNIATVFTAVASQALGLVCVAGVWYPKIAD